MLVWVTETAPVVGEDGQPIPGSERRCYVEMDLPPGLDEAGKRSRDAIKRAVKTAVYKEGMTEYGNKDLAVISRDEIFQVKYERVTVTKLLPPEQAEKVRAENGKDCISSTDEDDEEEEDATYDDEEEDEDSDS